MTEIEKENNVRISRQNISYYDTIAENYDKILNDDGKNNIVRAIVARKFTSVVKKGNVLDFGGGTGRDLDWLVQQDYRVIFCEPSTAMRKIAISRIKSELPQTNISVLDDYNSDFRNWDSIFPFKQDLDAVIANFAVINCIPDIQLLFEKLALSIKPDGIILALLLDNFLLKRLRSNFKGTIKSFFTGFPIVINIEYNDKRQEVFLHTNRKIRNAIKSRFELVRLERLHQFGFCLIHLKRK